MFFAELTKNQWIAVGAGAVGLVIGIVFIVMGFLSRRKLSAMKGLETVSAAQACQMAGTVDGCPVELFGIVETSQPLTSPATNTPCVYFRHKVERLERDTRTDSDGYTHTDETWRTIADNKLSAPFHVRDSTGDIAVQPDSAEFVARQTMNSQPGSYGYDSPNYSAGGSLGGVLDTVMEVLTIGGGGYLRTSEWVIPVGQPVYVIGSAKKSRLGVEVGQGDGPFIISYKSEEELTRKYTLHSVLWFVFGGLLSAGGIAGIVYGLK